MLYYCFFIGDEYSFVKINININATVLILQLIMDGQLIFFLLVYGLVNVNVNINVNTNVTTTYITKNNSIKDIFNNIISMSNVLC